MLRVVLPLAAAGLIAVAAVPAQGGAEDKAACLAAFDQGQQLKLDGHFRKAREQLLACARPACPGLVRQDCNKLLGELAATMPSIVVGARDEEGHDRVDVQVTLDGVRIASKLDGNALELDPGVHQLHLEAPGCVPADEQIVARTGDRARNVAILLRRPASTAPPPATTAVPRTEDAPHGPSHDIVYALVGLGLVAGGAAAILDGTATSDANHLRATCAPNCPSADVDSIRQRYLFAGIGAGVGVVALGAAAYLFFSSPDPAPAAKTTGLTFDLLADPQGVRGGLRGRF